MFPQTENILSHIVKDPNLLVKLLKVETTKQKGDLFTKELDRCRFVECCRMIGMLPASERARALVLRVSQELGNSSINLSSFIRHLNA